MRVDWVFVTFVPLVVIGGALIDLGISLAVATISFWFIRVDTLRWVVMSLEQDFTRYPISIYTRGVRIVLTFVLPFAFMNYFPATYFLQKTRRRFEPQPRGRPAHAGDRPGVGLRRVRLLASRTAPLPRNRFVRRALFLGGAAARAVSGRGADRHRTCRRRWRAPRRTLPGTLGVCARTLGAQRPLVAYRAAEIFPTASIIKVLIMATAYALDEATRGILSHELVFDRASDLIGGSDFMTNQPDGARFTVGQLIVPMIQVSDNTAANMLIGYFGVETRSTRPARTPA